MTKKLRMFSGLGLLIATFLLNGCAQRPETEYNKKVVSSTFSAYDFSKNILDGVDGYDVSYLTTSGTDLHSFVPTTKDIVNLATADLVIYIGGPSDEWIEDAIKNKVNPNQKVICLMELLKDSIVEEEFIEGMTEEEEEEEGIEYDEHVWMSLDNASVIAKEISLKLSEIDPSNKPSFDKNLEKYVSKLDTLRADFEKGIKEGTKDTVIVCDRFPFRYLFDEFDLKYYAAFPGCSAESEAGFDTVVFLSNKISQLNVDYVCVLENSPGEISKVVLDSSDKKDVGVLSLNSLQSVSMADVDSGASYLGIMRDNLETLTLLTR